MLIRTAELTDINALSEVEAECFPPAEAASPKEIEERVKAYANHFWLLFDDDKLVSFVDGFCTDEKDLTDEMYADASMHNENGAWQMIFGVNTIPSARKKGFAGKLLRTAIDNAKMSGRKGVVLTCKDKLVDYYASFGFKKEGISDSTHGGAVWYQMRLEF